MERTPGPVVHCSGATLSVSIRGRSERTGERRLYQSTKSTNTTFEARDGTRSVGSFKGAARSLACDGERAIVTTGWSLIHPPELPPATKEQPQEAGVLTRDDLLRLPRHQYFNAVAVFTGGEWQWSVKPQLVLSATATPIGLCIVEGAKETDRRVRCLR